jgi:hypothetical protein
MSLCLACRWNGRRIAKNSIPIRFAPDRHYHMRPAMGWVDHARGADGSAANCV